ncbi:divisome protein SepX/GlpR [Kitasatospora sp. NPDC054939]
MSSSGLIYAVIVGAWAAYLVPMWLRRQDELNEARPTERFSTAIRLLAGRSALERRASRALGDERRDDGERSDGQGDGRGGDPSTADDAHPAGTTGAVGESGMPGDSGVPGFGGAPAAGGADGSVGAAAAEGGPSGDRAVERVVRHVVERTPESSRGPDERAPGRAADHGQDRSGDRDPGRRGGIDRRAQLLARRRRMVTVLFLAFAVGAVVAAVAGLAFLWVPAVPAILLTLYIGHLRKLERQRYEVKLDRVRAAQAAERLRDRERQRAGIGGPAPVADAPEPRADETDEPARPHLKLAAEPSPQVVRAAGPASALVEATDHEEWVDGMRERAAAGPDSWEPVPVPLPTYVTAPVAPRVNRGLDLSAPGTWTAGRPAESRTTPLFDQYAADPSAADDYAGRPRAANE